MTFSLSNFTGGGLVNGSAPFQSIRPTNGLPTIDFGSFGGSSIVNDFLGLRSLEDQQARQAGQADAGGQPPIDGPSDGGILSTIFNGVTSVLGQAAANPGAVLSILQTLSQAGIVRGSVGAALAPQAGAPVSPSNGLSAMDFQSPEARMALAQALIRTGQLQLPASAFAGGAMQPNLFAQLAGVLPSILGGVAGAATPVALNAIGDGASALLALANSGAVGGCGRTMQRANMMNAMGIFKMGCNGPRVPNRVYVDNPDGSVQVLYNAGRATRGSRERGLAKRLAKQNGLTTSRRGGRRPR